MTSILRVLPAIVLAMSCGLASAADHARYHVVESTTLDLMAGPADTAALLSPDGSRLLHVGSDDVCLLERADAFSWNKVACVDNTGNLDLRGSEDLLWSPRGDRLAMPTYVTGLLHFRDTDIRLLDPATLTATNLTEDGLDDSLFDNRMPGSFDVTARWADDDTIAFLRYPIPKEGGAGKGGPPGLMTIGAAGGEPKLLFAIPGADRLRVYALAVSADGRRIAYSFDDRKNAAIAGIYVLEMASPQPKRVAAMAAVGGPPSGLAFSADGNFLLSLGAGETGLDARVIDLATGKVVPVDTARNVTGVAWSPAGSALAYVTSDRAPAAPGGLFLAAHPGEPGRQLLKQALMPPVCCGRLPFTWASNDTMVVGNVEKPGAPLFVRLGE